MTRAWIPLLLAGLGVSCGGEAPTSMDGLAPDFAIAGNSGCYPVTVDSDASGAFPSFAGAATGDVVADVSVQFDPGALFPRGVVVGLEGIETWNVTGGIIEELWGESFTLTTRSLVNSRPDNDPLLWEITGNASGASVVSTANLTYHGTFDFRDQTPPYEVDLVYRGVICP